MPKPCCHKRPVEILININVVAPRRNVKFDANILAIWLVSTKVRYSWYFKHSYIVLGDLENDQFCDLGHEGVLLGKMLQWATEQHPCSKQDSVSWLRHLQGGGTLSIRLCHCILNLKRRSGLTFPFFVALLLLLKKSSGPVKSAAFGAEHVSLLTWDQILAVHSKCQIWLGTSWLFPVAQNRVLPALSLLCNYRSGKMPR